MLGPFASEDRVTGSGGTRSVFALKLQILQNGYCYNEVNYNCAEEE